MFWGKTNSLGENTAAPSAERRSFGLPKCLPVRLLPPRIDPAEREVATPLLRFDADTVVHGAANSLLATEIALRCLNRDVPEQELDLV